MVRSEVERLRVLDYTYRKVVIVYLYIIYILHIYYAYIALIQYTHTSH